MKSTRGNYKLEAIENLVRMSSEHDGHICDFDLAGLVGEILIEPEKRHAKDYEMLETSIRGIRESLKVYVDQQSELRKELDEMPGGYRNGQDIKKLKEHLDKMDKYIDSRSAVVERRLDALEPKYEATEKAVVMLIQWNNESIQRIEELEKLLQSWNNVTVHSRLNDMEKSLEDLKRSWVSNFNNLSCSVAKNTECCQNTVAAGKSVEDRLSTAEQRITNIAEDFVFLRNKLKEIFLKM